MYFSGICEKLGFILPFPSQLVICLSWNFSIMKSLSFVAAALAVGHVFALPSNSLLEKLGQLERMGKLDRRQAGGIGAMVNQAINRESIPTVSLRLNLD